MSQEERDWLEWLKRARDGVVTQRQAAEKMGVSDRWVRRLLRRMKTEGDGVVVHGLRGRASKALQANRAGKPGGIRVATGGLAPTAFGANSVASALGCRARRDPGTADRT
jgi:predicted ArsR family transcriptional regulator